MMGYGIKNSALQVSRDPLILHRKSLVREIKDQRNFQAWSRFARGSLGVKGEEGLPQNTRILFNTFVRATGSPLTMTEPSQHVQEPWLDRCWADYPRQGLSSCHFLFEVLFHLADSLSSTGSILGVNETELSAVLVCTLFRTVVLQSCGFKIH